MRVSGERRFIQHASKTRCDARPKLCGCCKRALHRPGIGMLVVAPDMYGLRASVRYGALYGYSHEGNS